MLSGLVDGLLVGWILTYFDVDEIAIDVLQPFTDVTLTQSHYYFVLGIIGLISGVISG